MKNHLIQTHKHWEKKKINKTQQIQTQEGKKIPRKKKTIPNGSGFSEAEEIGGSEKNA